LTLPKELAKRVGEKFEVAIFPMKRNSIYAFTKNLARRKKFTGYSEKDIEKIIHESRGIMK